MPVCLSPRSSVLTPTLGTGHHPKAAISDARAGPLCHSRLGIKGPRAPARGGYDEQLAQQVSAGGPAGEDAVLELLLRRRPRCWEDALALPATVCVVSPRSLDALAVAWRWCRLLQRRREGGGEG
jgi:hypothetical protein